MSPTEREWVSTGKSLNWYL